MADTETASYRAERPITNTDFGPGEGWVVFAGFALIMMGIMRFFDALWAFSYKGTVPANLQNAILGHSLRTYGWLWLFVSIALFLCGFGVFVRNQISRWVGMVAGAIAVITAIWWMPYYPVWSVAYIAVGVLVIYSLAAYGGRHPAAQPPRV